MTYEEGMAIIARINHRLDQIAALEARDAWFGGLAAEGHFEGEREQLMRRTDEVLDDLSKALGLP